jgi:hypothetical protein
LQTEIEIPVYIMVGVGGSSHFPDTLYLIPFKNVTSNYILTSSLTQYEVKLNQVIDFSDH